MGNITKIINGNNTNQGGFVVAINRGGSTAVTASGAPSMNQVPVYEVLESGYVTKFDDYGLRRTTVEMGDWNMDSTGFIKVNHGLNYSDTWKGTRQVEFTVRNDADTTYYVDGAFSSQAMLADDIAVSGVTSKKVVMIRREGASFDSSDFDSTSYNRGWVTVWYE
tara:strand:+ start:66 stop:560 length:495 start_codon:yes stop_codon:yes gene_type:complete